MRLVLNDQTQDSTKFFRRDHFESHSRVERHVKGNVSECGQRDLSISSGRGPLADGHDESPAETPVPVLGVDINLLEMSDRGVEYLNVRKSDGNVIGKGNPQMTVSLGRIQYFPRRCLGENRLGGVAGEKCGCGELNRR
jgi:hypothetical protein